MNKLILLFAISLFFGCANDNTTIEISSKCSSEIVLDSFCQKPFRYNDNILLKSISKDYSITLHRVKNRHRTNIIDTVFQIIGSGVDLSLYQAPGNKLLVNHFIITSPSFEGFSSNLKIGQNRGEVASYLNDTIDSNCDTISLVNFEGYISPVVLIFNDDTLFSITKTSDHLNLLTDTSNIIESQDGFTLLRLQKLDFKAFYNSFMNEFILDSIGFNLDGECIGFSIDKLDSLEFQIVDSLKRKGRVFEDWKEHMSYKKLGKLLINDSAYFLIVNIREFDGLNYRIIAMNFVENIIESAFTIAYYGNAAECSEISKVYQVDSLYTSRTIERCYVEETDPSDGMDTSYVEFQFDSDSLRFHF